MCSAADDPSTYDEPLEDTVDWKALRLRRIARSEHASELERRHGIPQRPGWIEKEADRMRHSQARRGWQYDPSER